MRSMLFAALFLAACGGEAEKKTTEPKVEEPKAEEPKAEEPKAEEPKAEEPVADAGNAENGKVKYVALCSACHGEAGDGSGPAGAALDPHPANFTAEGFFDTRDDAHVRKVIKEGGPSVGKSPLMAPFGAQLTDAEIADVAAYVQSFKK